jgi:hypothetical protein
MNIITDMILNENHSEDHVDKDNSVRPSRMNEAKSVTSCNCYSVLLLWVGKKSPRNSLIIPKAIVLEQSALQSIATVNQAYMSRWLKILWHFNLITLS